MLESPVLESQKQAGATLGEAHGWNLPSVYTSVEDEYRAITEGVGLVDRSYVGRLTVSGEDALDLLDRLSTNNLDDLEVGQVMGTVLTTNKGRIIDLLFVLYLPEHLVVLTSPECRDKVAEWIDFYTFVEDVTVQDDTESTAMLSLVGPEAVGLVDSMVGGEPVPQYEMAEFSIGEVSALAARTDFVGVPGYDLIVEASRAKALWDALADKGATPVGTQALEALRIERGVAAHGSELGEDYNPLEANLMHFISFNKGCYIGQEVVAGLNTYDKVQKHVVGLSLESDATPELNTDLLADGKKVGTLTSAARSPRDGKMIGLGFVRNAQAEPGTVLQVATSQGEVAVTVGQLPLE